MFRNSVRLAVLALAALPALAATAVPAQAATDSYLSRTTGFVGTTSWVQYFDFDNPAFGNVHVGSLQAFETSVGSADVFSFIDDYECPAGVYPYEPGGEACAYTGFRLLEGYGIAFTVGKRGASATLKGSLTARTPGDPHTGEGGTVLGQVPADFTWTATGDPQRSTSTYRYRDGNTYVSETYRTTSRSTSMSGRLGPMLFQEARFATGTLEAFKTTSRFRG